MRTRTGLCYPKINANANSNTISTLCFQKHSSNNNNTMKKMMKKQSNNNNNRALVSSDEDDDNDEVFIITCKKRDLFSSRTDFSSPNNNNIKVNTSTDNTKEQHHRTPRRKRAKISPEFRNAGDSGPDMFDELPDDLVITILSKLSASATCPADFVNVLLTCKRFNGLGLNSIVLAKASPKSFAVKAKNWSDSSHRFLKMCSDAGNVDACYTLGMIRFYCLQNRGSGASLMAKAAINSHAPALYSLAVIQFNGSGGSKSDKDLRAGVALCARAAFLGHVDALRELGHCLQDGYGVRQNVSEGRRFLVQANARELAASLTCQNQNSSSSYWLSHPPTGTRHVASNTSHVASSNLGCPLLSDFGCNVPAPEAHPANRFLSDWFESRASGPGLGFGSGLRLCSHSGCGRPETRKHEFRRCSVCGAVNYCSRACQALDWKLKHKGECVPMERWVEVEEDENNNNHNININNINAGDGDGDVDMDGDGDVNMES